MKIFVTIVVIGVIVLMLFLILPPVLRNGFKLDFYDYLARSILHKDNTFSQQRAKALVLLYGSGMGGDDAAFDYYESWGHEGEKELLKLANNKRYRKKVFLFLFILVQAGQGSLESRDFCINYLSEIKDPQIKEHFEKELLENE